MPPPLTLTLTLSPYVRIENQERFWPAALEKMKAGNQYGHVLLKSDYWKKFEGTALKVCNPDPDTLTLTLNHTHRSP